MKCKTIQERLELEIYANAGDDIHDPYTGKSLSMKEVFDKAHRKAVKKIALKFNLPWPPQPEWQDDVRNAGMYEPLYQCNVCGEMHTSIVESQLCGRDLSEEIVEKLDLNNIKPEQIFCHCPGRIERV